MKLTLKRIKELREYDGLPSKAEYQALLDSARALARLEDHAGLHAVLAESRIDGSWQVELNIDCEDRPWVVGPNLPAAINAALDTAEAETK